MNTLQYQSNHPMPTILDFRLHSARRNLSDLRTFVDSIRRRNDHLWYLHTALVQDNSEIVKSLNKLRKQLENASEHANLTPPLDQQDITTAIDRARQHLDSLSRLLQDAKDYATKISVLQLDSKMLDDRNDEFSDKIADGSQKLDWIYDEAHKPGVRLEESWNNLKSLGNLWVEYLDYLAGLSLRHDGLPAGVCDIADALINELQGQSKNLGALTIPGRDGCVGVLPKVVYLRFPERWTVWALPLAAHEFWHIMESSKSNFMTGLINRIVREYQIDISQYSRENYPNLKELMVLAKVETPEQLSEHLADAFATFTLGPAYAYSSVLLSLDPLVLFDHQRAESIFRALKALNEIDEYPLFSDALGSLTDLWRQAMVEVGVKSQASAHYFKRWIDLLLNYLKDITNLPFPKTHWGKRDGLIKALTTATDIGR